MKKLILILFTIISLSAQAQISDELTQDTIDLWIVTNQMRTITAARLNTILSHLNLNKIHKDSIDGFAHWTLTTNDIENNNTGKVILAGDSTFFDVMPDEGDKVGRILHVNQYKEVEWISPSGLGDRIDSGRFATPTPYTTWIRDTTDKQLEVAQEYDQVVLTWPDSIMYTASNTGADYTIAHTYEAFKFVADKDYPLGTLGPIDLYVKKDGSITNVTGALQKYIYSDNAGVPGTALTAITEPEMYGHISTSYAAYPSQNGSPALTSGTAYWLVVVRSAAASGGNVYVQCAASGTAMAAYSSDGSSWTPVNSYTVNYRIHWQGDAALDITASHHFGINVYSETEYGIQATGVYDPGVRGISTNAEGVQGVSTYGPGVQGNSTHGIGINGASTNQAGGYFTSTNYYGLISTTAKTGFSGVWGDGTVSGARGGNFTSLDSYGLVAGSGSGNAVYGYSTSGIPIYLYGNPSATNATSTIAKLEIGSSGTPAAGIGSTIDWYNENSSGSGVLSGQIGSYSQKVTASSERGALLFRTLGSDGCATRATIDSNGTFAVTAQKGYAISGTAVQSGYAGVYGNGAFSGGRGGYFEATNTYGIVAGATTGNAIYGNTSSGTTLYLYKYAGTANAVTEIAKLEMGTTGTAAAGFGGMIAFYNEDAGGGADRLGGISCKTQRAVNGGEGGALAFSTYATVGGFAERMVIDSTGNVSVTGNLKSGTGTIVDNDATPDVRGANTFIYAGTANSVAPTDLDNPVVGAYYTFIGNSDTYTLNFPGSTNFKMAGAGKNLGQYDNITFYCQADNLYIMVSYNDITP